MKSWSLIIFAVVVGSYSTYAGVTQSKNVRTLKETNKYKPKLTFHFIISTPKHIDEMNFKTLLTMALRDEGAVDLCADSFKRRYSNYKMTIEPDSVIGLVNREGLITYETTKGSNFLIAVDGPTFEIVSVDLDTLLKAVRIFGIGMKKLTINMDNVDRETAEIIYDYAETYAY